MRRRLLEDDWTVDGYTSPRLWGISAANSRADAIRKAVSRLRRCRGRVSVYHGDRLVWQRGISQNLTRL